MLAPVSTMAAETSCNDNGGAGWPYTVSSTTNITIPFSFGDVSTAYDVNVFFETTKVWVGDLTAYVTSPAGTEVQLFERPGTAIDENTLGPPYGCNQSDMQVTFDDEAANGINVEGVCNAGAPTISGTYRAQAATGNELAAFDGEDPTGDWSFRLVHSEPFDPGVLDEACITAAFAAVTFDKWVSSDATCTDNIESIAVAPGTDVYFCYTVENPSTETFSIGAADWSDDQGHDLSGLQGTYLQNDVVTIVDGPYVAGSPSLPVGTTVNNASVTANFATANYNGILVTDESATAIVGNPDFSASTKTVVDLNGGSAEPGDVIEYTITINETAGIFTPDVSISDIVDPALGAITITTLPVGATDNSVGNNIDIDGISVPANGSVALVFEASIGGAVTPGTTIANTATISHADSGVSVDAIAPDVVVSAPDLSTSTKTELDVNGLPSIAGDIVRYTISINETGGNAATDVTLNDTVDIHLTGVTVTSLPAGATDNSVGNNVSVSGITVPPNGTATVVIEGTISGLAPIGTLIDNTATITDLPSGATASPAAASITVSSAAASGIKQLYTANLNTGTPDLTRVVPGGNTNTGNFGVGASVTLDMTPEFQAPFTITGGTDITLNLNLQRRNGGGSRTVEVELFNGGTGVSIGTDSVTWNAGGTQYLTFTITPVADVDFDPTDFLRLVVRNNAGGNVRLRSLINGNQSQILMDSSTVINVDNVAVYAAAYPDTTQYSSYTPGSNVFIRATVSDPFGNADITSAEVTITDASPTVQITDAAMNSVATPDGATRIYEYPYTVPATPDGFWDISVTANEGSEGTVSHTVSSPMIIGTANLTVSKTNEVISDPINASNPKAIPGAIIEYSIEVINTGFGYADDGTVSIIAPIDTNDATLLLGDPADPASFTDGAVSSGLTYSFAGLADINDDIAFSSDDCGSFVTPDAGTGGFDISTPSINCVRFNPSGELRGSDGVNNPSFTIRFRVRVD